jgi:hypothetical protein
MLRKSFKKRLVFSTLVLWILAAMFVFVSCGGNDAGSDPAPDDSLLPRLTGTWYRSGGDDANAWEDGYVITNATVTRISSQGGAALSPKTGSVEHVYNFSKIAGCVIVKYGDAEYNAVYFNNLLTSTGTVDLTDAYVVADGSSSAMESLEEAKDRFRPENAETYGGGNTQPPTRFARYDDHDLNPLLLGTFRTNGGEGADAWTDEYVVTHATITHISTFGGIETGSIEYVYNITDTAGSIIVKYTGGSNSGKYDAVHFKNLASGQVLLGNAYTVADYTVPSAVSTLDAAKGRFNPANAEAYGGWTVQMGEAQTRFVNNHQFNAGLAGTWTVSGGEGANAWTDTFTITLGAGAQKTRISHSGSFGYTDAEVEYVYNITDTAGCIIIKYPAGSNSGRLFDAVYFKDLSDTQVLLGDAYDATDPGWDAAVYSLDAAIERFDPANAEAYGGWTAQMGSPQQKQQ